jgi:charged multivesicular body protein 2A
MGAMNRGLNLPQIQRIMNDFEKESATMDMKEEMMSDAVDDVMDDELEDEEVEGDKILKEVLDEIGIGLQQQVRLSTMFGSRLDTVPDRDSCVCQLTDAPNTIVANSALTSGKQAVALGAHDSPSFPAGGGSGGGGGGPSPEDDLQARLENLRRS